MRLGTVRAGYGAILLFAPPGSISWVVRHPLDAQARRVARVLGARQILQGALEASVATPARQRVGAGIDALHCLSMIAAAVAWRRYRALARDDAVAAAAFAVAAAIRARAL
jgi:hypothetical protein